jgi:hypothetical protein
MKMFKEFFKKEVTKTNAKIVSLTKKLKKAAGIKTKQPTKLQLINMKKQNIPTNRRKKERRY